MGSFLKYKYYDTPEGRDYFHKLFCTTKYAAAFGFVGATYDVMLNSQPKGYGPIAARYIYLNGPILGMTAAFTSVTFISANVRGKDDVFNYVYGAIGAGSVWGAFRQRIYSGIQASIYLAIILAAKKYCVLEGWEMLPGPKMRYIGGPNYVKNSDYTITQDRPRGWTKNAADA